MRHAWLSILMIIVAGTLGGCATVAQRDPLQVTVAGIESLPGEGLEMRMMVKLRVQNPNDEPVEYDGIYLKLDVQGNTFATGVSDERGNVPRYGETIIAVPMTISALRVVSRVLGIVSGGGIPAGDKLRYKLDGKLDGPGFGSTRFKLDGEFTLPASKATPEKS